MPHLGNLVRAFKLCIYSLYSLDRNTRKTTFAEIFELFSDLLSTCLPNLEVLHENSLRSYLPVLKALKNSQLKRLRALEVPQGDEKEIEFANYRACILLLKDRIGHISLHVSEKDKSTRTAASKLVTSRSLFRKLGKFDRLEQLWIEKKTVKELRDLEFIVASCKSLKTLWFTFYPPLPLMKDSLLVKNNAAIDAIQSYTPVHNITTLTATVAFSVDYRILLYIMHKFPKIDSLVIEISEKSLSVPLNHQILSQLLNRYSKIYSFQLHSIGFDQNTISNTINDYWEAYSTPGSEYLEFEYSTETPYRGFCVLDIGKPKGQTLFQYYKTSVDSLYVDFLEKNGKFIGEMYINFGPEDVIHHARLKLPEEFLIDAFKYCRNLRELKIDTCILKRLDNIIDLDSREKISLQSFDINNCIVHSGALEQLSMNLHEIQKLSLSHVMYRSCDNLSPLLEIMEDDLMPYIVMPHTKIDAIYFHDIYAEFKFSVEVFAVSEEEYYYFRFDEKLMPSSEQEYIQENDAFHFYICCQNLPKLVF